MTGTADQPDTAALPPCGQSKEWHDTVADIAHSTTLPKSWVRWARLTVRIDEEAHRGR